ncbi:methyltransferase domain-containing protein [Nocardioides sp. CFH 31398]|uniref:methyltransferase domain-containing protein n=1 Tax=Nocardioides sp. CFH 31398 TaxID=2919579 RepID=UPI001F06D6F6|nr:methyltransferase domain-containing protein [Nocardioides sp. CFH 31398]MCH1868264.1 methyltransferase domain-containing protein [Nocardioides sp. CFH 31398]
MPAPTPERPSERRGAARTTVLWATLRDALPSEPGDVLDVGGGTGGLAVRVAELGHRVTVVDPSPDALAMLARRADERGVADRVRGVQGDLADLGSVEPVDAVLCHGVLEVAPDPAAALGALAGCLRADGVLSLVVAQRYAAVLARAMAGHLVAARELLAAGPGDVPAGGPGRGRRFTHEELRPLLGDAGLDVVSVHGVRVFADLVPGALLDLEPGAAQALVELEQAAAARPELFPLATQLHVVARGART